MADLAIEEVTVGTGPEAVPGRTVIVHYVGTLPDGSRDGTRESPECAPAACASS